VTVGAEIDYNVPEDLRTRRDSPANLEARCTTLDTGTCLKKHSGSDLEGRKRASTSRVTTVSECFVIKTLPGPRLDAGAPRGARTAAQHRKRAPLRTAMEVAEREDSYIGRIVERHGRPTSSAKTTFSSCPTTACEGRSEVFARMWRSAKEGLITLDSRGEQRTGELPLGRWRFLRDCRAETPTIDNRGPGHAVFSKWATQAQKPIARLISHEELERLGAIPQAALVPRSRCQDFPLLRNL